MASLEKKVEESGDETAAEEKKLNEIRDLVAEQDAELYGFKTDLRKLRGEFEETKYRVNKNMESLDQGLDEANKEIGKHSEEIASQDKRISRLESFMGMEASEKFKALAESRFPEKADLGKLTEDELYSTAKKAFDDGDYKIALQGFELFLKKFPDSNNADNARFWMGEVYFEEKWFEKAILEYEKVIKNYPEGNKVPGAYLKQGFAFSELGENANARLILQTLIQKYPDSNEAKIARKKLAAIE
ncbi:MAG: tol-pal system protein YbgF [Desulfobacterales bacterium]|nr:tol-pal system protein YbgF [Desulfobacterales bacterium]